MSNLKISTIRAKDNTPIITAIFVPDNKPAGVIQMVHGFGEHHAAYHATAEYFCEKGYACVCFDQRGHGDGHVNNRGVLSGYNLFLDDVETVRAEIAAAFPGLPVYLYGHSMGGNISVNYILRRCAGGRLPFEQGSHNNLSAAGGSTCLGYEKLVLETPWFRLKTPMPAPVVFAAGILGKISYKFAATSKLMYEAITRDPAGVERIRNDKRYHNRLSMRIFTQITAAGEYAIENAAKLTLPALLLCADADQIVSPDAIKAFAHNAGKNVELYVEAEGYHALHSDAEPTKTRVLEKILAFLK